MVILVANIPPRNDLSAATKTSKGNPTTNTDAHEMHVQYSSACVHSTALHKVRMAHVVWQDLSDEGAGAYDCACPALHAIAL